MSVKWLLSLMIFACSQILVAAHYGSPEECEFLEKVERLRANGKNELALEECNTKLQQLSNHTHQAFYLTVAHEKARVLFTLGDFEGARDFLRPIKNLAPVDAEDYKAAWGDCMYDLGKAYDFVDEPDSAIYFFKLALNARLDLKYPDHEKLADNYSYLGYIYRFIKGDYTLAEKYYLKEGEELFRFKAADFTKARHYINLAACISLNDNERALNCNFKALSYLGSSEQDMVLKRQCLNNVANTYFRKNDFTNSRKFYRQCLPPLTDGHRDYNAEDIVILENLGVAYAKLGKLDSSRIYLSQAWALSKRFFGNSSKEAVESMFLYCLSFPDSEEAVKFRTEVLAEKLRLFGSENKEIIRVYGNFADWFVKTNQPDSALFYFEKALGSTSEEYPNLRGTGSGELIDAAGFAHAINGKAKLLFELGKKNKSITYVSAAIRHYYLLSKVHDEFLIYKNSERERLDFARNSKEIYSKAIEACYYHYELTQKGLEDLWFFMERSKSAVLMLQAQEADQELNGSTNNDLYSIKRTLKGKIKHLEDQLNLNNDNSDSMRVLLFDSYKELDSVNKLLLVDEEGISGSKRVLNIGEVRDELLNGADDCVIGIHIGEDVLYAVAIMAGEVKVLRVGNDDFKLLRGSCLKLQNLMSGRKSLDDHEVGFMTFVKNAAQVYNVLMKPLNVDGKNSIIVIPDGFLNGIPFEALLTEATISSDRVDYRSLPYLIKKSALTYGYSASWLGFTQRGLNIESNSSSVLAFAFARANDAQKKQSLPASKEEVNAIEKVWGQDFQSYQGENASELNFKRNVGKYGLIHLAIHNEVDDNNPLNSGLLFREDKVEDGILHVYEVYQLMVPAKMVVLSACETGLGVYQEGEGYMSVGRAFAQRGVPYIVSSLWKTSDNHSSNLMAEFYSHVRKGNSPAEALHKSKLKFIEESDEYAAHPANWASYVCVGNVDETITEKGEFKLSNKIISGVVGILILLGLYFWISHRKESLTIHPK